MAGKGSLKHSKQGQASKERLLLGMRKHTANGKHAHVKTFHKIEWGS